MTPSQNIKQSMEWEEYLKGIGWKTIRTSTDVLMDLMDLKIGYLLKIQHPHPLNETDLIEIEKIAKDYKSMIVKIEPGIGQDTSILEKFNYVISSNPLSVPSTIYINLELSEKQLWENVSHSGKYSINRAKREKAVVRFFQNPSDNELKIFYELLKETGRKKRFYIFPFKELLLRIRAFGEKSYLALVYDNHGDLCGGKTYLGNNEVITYTVGGTSEKGRKDKSGYLLLWESILYFKSLGYKIMDLEGKDDSRYPSFTKNWAGFSYFKEKFNGEVIEFPFTYVKYLSPVLKILKNFVPMPF